MKQEKKNRSRALAGALRNPSKDTSKKLETIIPRRRRKRYRITVTPDFWENVGLMAFILSTPLLAIILTVLTGKM